MKTEINFSALSSKVFLSSGESLSSKDLFTLSLDFLSRVKRLTSIDKVGLKLGFYFKSSDLFLKSLFAFWNSDLSIVLFDQQLDAKALQRRILTINLNYIISDTCLDNATAVEVIEGVYLHIFHEKADELLKNMVPRGAIVLFTSGSENEPKPVVIKKDSILRNVQKVITYTRLSSQDRTILTLPLSYSYALSQCFAHLLSGSSIHLTESGYIFDNIYSLIQSLCVSNFSATPYFYRLLNNHLLSSTDNIISFDHLRFFMNAGGPLDDAIINNICNRFKNIQFFNNYGQTEASPRLCYDVFTKDSNSFKGVGKPLPGVSIKIDKPDIDGVGEISYKSEDAMLGYYPVISEERRLKTFNTGDLGYITKEKNLIVIGRKDSMLKVNGRKVYLYHIEKKILALDGVVDVKLFREPHEQYGEYLKAVIILRDLSKKFEIRNSIKQTFDKAIQPKIVLFRKSFLTNSNGKIIAG